MKAMTPRLLALTAGTLLFWSAACADIPLFLDQFSADPTARNFNGKIYLVNSHDILPPAGVRGGFVMADYHVHSSVDLMDWTDHGAIVDQKDVPWANQNYGMWAPDLVFKNGKYYFYFPTNSKVTDDGRTRRAQGIQRVGVAVADKPEGPYKIEPDSIPNIPWSIDPSVLIDPKDNQAYLIYALNDFFIAKLKDNMLELAEEPKLMKNFPNSRTEGLIEGPFAFERKGIYYMAYPHAKGTELLEYATADNPVGPYTFKGIIMDQLASKCWTNQCSLVEYQGQWILFYHDKDLSPNDGSRRSVRADYTTFNDDGTINKVTPTLRGVGICDAKRQIQIDRYSDVSKTGTAVTYLNAGKTSEGWKIALSDKDAFVQYDRVQFGKTPLKSVKVRANSAAGATVEIRLDKPDGPLLAKVEIPATADWKEISANLTTVPSDLHNLVVTLPEAKKVEIDWVSCE
jgi:beta-xylosidase